VVNLSKIREREQVLLQRKAKAESELARLHKKQKEAARRDDTRRKIVLGGALLKAMDEGVLSSEIGRKLVARFVSERDQKLFEGSALAASAASAERAASYPPGDGGGE